MALNTVRRWLNMLPSVVWYGVGGVEWDGLIDNVDDAGDADGEMIWMVRWSR